MSTQNQKEPIREDAKHEIFTQFVMLLAGLSPQERADMLKQVADYYYIKD
jgi:hypothetical protein